MDSSAGLVLVDMRTRENLKYESPCKIQRLLCTRLAANGSWSIVLTFNLKFSLSGSTSIGHSLQMVSD
jgi:hypothetical protein